MGFDSQLSMLSLSDLPTEEWAVFKEGKLQVSPDGWDRKQMVFGGIWPDVVSPGELMALAPEDFDGGWIGGQPYLAIDGDEHFYIQAVEFTCHGPVWLATCEVLGIADPDRPAKLRGGTGTEQQQAQNVTIFGFGGPFDKVRALMPAMEWTRTYPLVGVAPDMSQIGTEMSPVDAPDPPVNPWTFLTNPEVRAPAGWTLMNREPEFLTGVAKDKISLVRDTFAYIFRHAP